MVLFILTKELIFLLLFLSFLPSKTFHNKTSSKVSFVTQNLTSYYHNYTSNLHSISSKSTIPSSLLSDLNDTTPSSSSSSSPSASSSSFDLISILSDYPNIKSIGIEVEEALVFEQAVTHGTDAIKVGLSSIPEVFRAISGTIAGVASLSIKSVGGILNILSDILTEASIRSNRYQSKSMFIRSTSYLVSTVIHALSVLLHGLGRVCILTGDTIELITVGLGQALEDSFFGLTHVISFIHKVILFSLQRDHNSSSRSYSDQHHNHQDHQYHQNQQHRSQSNSNSNRRPLPDTTQSLLNSKTMNKSNRLGEVDVTTHLTMESEDSLDSVMFHNSSMIPSTMLYETSSHRQIYSWNNVTDHHSHHSHSHSIDVSTSISTAIPSSTQNKCEDQMMTLWERLGLRRLFNGKTSNRCPNTLLQHVSTKSYQDDIFGNQKSFVEKKECKNNQYIPIFDHDDKITSSTTIDNNNNYNNYTMLSKINIGSNGSLDLSNTDSLHDIPVLITLDFNDSEIIGSIHYKQPIILVDATKEIKNFNHGNSIVSIGESIHPFTEKTKSKKSIFHITIKSIVKSISDVFRMKQSMVSTNPNLRPLITRYMDEYEIDNIPTLRPHIFAGLVIIVLITYIYSSSLSNSTSKDSLNQSMPLLQSQSQSVSLNSITETPPITPSISIENNLSDHITDQRIDCSVKGNKSILSGSNINKVFQLVYIAIAIGILWIYLSLMEQMLRERILLDSSTKAIYYKYYKDSYNLDNINPIGYNPTSEEDIESAKWVNTLLHSLWSLNRNDKTNISQKRLEVERNIPSKYIEEGGLGPYIGITIKNMLTRQLALVPSGVANIQLKNFIIGSQPPLILGVRAIKRPDKKECLKYISNVSKINVNTSTTNKHDFNVSLDEEILLTSKSSKDKLFDIVSSNIANSLVYLSEVTSTAFQNNTTTSTSSKNSIKLEPLICEQIIADIDFSFVSKDMDLVFTLRPNDMKSVLPEGAISISDLSMRGRIRMHIDLIPDYPFVGNATISFIDFPVWDMTVSSFGGIDLSSIPGVYHWINVTMTWLLEQYNYPNYSPLDLKHTICPSCGKLAHPTGPEILIEIVKSFTNHIQSSATHAIQHVSHVTAPRVKRIISKRYSDVKESILAVSDFMQSNIGEVTTEFIGADGEMEY